MAIDPNQVDTVNPENVAFAVSEALQKRPLGIPSSGDGGSFNDGNTYGFYIPDGMLPFAMVALRPVDGISIRRLKQQIRRTNEEYNNIWKSSPEIVRAQIFSNKVYVAAVSFVKQYEMVRVALHRHGDLSRKYQSRVRRRDRAERLFYKLSDMTDAERESHII